MDQAALWSGPVETTRADVAPFAPVRLELSVAAVGRKAARIAVPAFLFFPTAGVVSFMAPFTAAGIAALALAILIVARLKGDRTVLSYDAETLTVTGLLGSATMMWVDVGDVQVRKAAFWNLKVMFTSGSRRNLVVLGRGNRLGGPDTLYIPIDLLGLDQPALARLISRLIMLRAGADPCHLDRSSLVTFATPPPHPGALTGPLIGNEPFDPDAIIARYMATRIATPEPPSSALDLDLDVLRARQHAEREQVHVEAKLGPVRRASFGRKVA